MPDKPELGAMRIITEGARLILQRFEPAPPHVPLPPGWSELASGETLDEIHKHILKLFNHYKDPYIAVDSSVPQYITAALRGIEWVMRNRSRWGL